VIADLHAHYPMRVLEGVDPGTSAEEVRKRSRHGQSFFRSAVIWFANRIGNFPTWDGSYRITPERLRAGNVGLAMSPLLRPFEEMDLHKPYAAKPDSSYFGELMTDLKAVEEEVATHPRDQLRLVHNRTELDECIAAGATALVHAVEGGCLLGGSEADIEENCVELADAGVGYVTVAHLFFRQIATNANAVPFIPDPLYDFAFPQPDRDRLTPLGKAVVRGLVRNRILIDLSHMDPPGIRETFALLDEIDPANEVPVMSTHAGYRFGTQQYMCDDEILLRIRRRNGVVGLIMAQHQLNDGLRTDHTTTFRESLDVIFSHIDRIAEVTGSYEHVAIGTDFDGFIKPTMTGLETPADLAILEQALQVRYGEETAELITFKNALRMLHAVWPKGQTVPPASPASPA
jgi:microsomal dipeptidase-like Zn-dependent dipeptidase